MPARSLLPLVFPRFLARHAPGIAGSSRHPRIPEAMPSPSLLLLASLALLLAWHAPGVAGSRHLNRHLSRHLRLASDPQHHMHSSVHNRHDHVIGWRAAVEDVMDASNDTRWEVLWQDLVPGRGKEEEEGQGLLECVNAAHDPSQKMTWEGVLSGELGSVKAVASWRPSEAQRPSVPLTLVTSATLDRLPQLHAQCLSWPGPLSAVLYQPLLLQQRPVRRTTGQEEEEEEGLGQPGGQEGQGQQQPGVGKDEEEEGTGFAGGQGVVTDEDEGARGEEGGAGGLSEANVAIMRQAVLQVAEFVSDLANLGSVCSLDVLLVYEVFSGESARDLLFPQNTLRNLARLQARTPLIAQLDVDLLPSRSLYEHMSRNGTADNIMRQATKEQTVFILPAFDVRGLLHQRAAWADALVTSDKESLVQSWKQNVTCQFAEAYPKAHALTNYPHWLGATMDYVVQYQDDAEPWLLSERLSVPWHDERYRGYGLNKQQMVAAVSAAGFKFKVPHDVFTVHRAHEKSELRTILLEGQGRQEQGVPDIFAHNQMLYAKQRAMHQAGQAFAAPVSPAVKRCLSTLTWWQGRGRVGEQPAVAAATVAA